MSGRRSQPALHYDAYFRDELPFGTLVRLQYGGNSKGKLGVVVGYEPMKWDGGKRPHRVIVETECPPQPGSRKYMRVRKLAAADFLVIGSKALAPAQGG